MSTRTSFFHVLLGSYNKKLNSKVASSANLIESTIESSQQSAHHASLKRGRIQDLTESKSSKKNHNTKSVFFSLE